MTVAELIAKLQQFDPATRVVSTGYEGGLCDMGDPERVEVVLGVNTEWYYGPHEKVEDSWCGCKPLDGRETTVAVRVG